MGLERSPPDAAKMVELSYDGERLKTYQVPQSPSDCGLRYRSPGEDGEMLVSMADGQQPTRYAATSVSAATNVALRPDMPLVSPARPGGLTARLTSIRPYLALKLGSSKARRLSVAHL